MSDLKLVLFLTFALLCTTNTRTWADRLRDKLGMPDGVPFVNERDLIDHTEAGVEFIRQAVRRNRTLHYVDLSVQHAVERHTAVELKD